jgi:hypothetical protein
MPAPTAFGTSPKSGMKSKTHYPKFFFRIWGKMGETNCKVIHETSIISFETISSDIAGSEGLKERNVESRQEV